MDEPGSPLGSPHRRREDAALLTGRAEFTDDLQAPGMVHLAFVRSRHGHARVEGVDASAATGMDGVLAVYTWEDVAASDAPGVVPVEDAALAADVPGHPALARDRVRYHGQPVAAVVAGDRYAANDAAGAVTVEYERLRAVTDPREAAAGDAPTLFEAAPDNVLLERSVGDPDATEAAFEEADHAIELDVEHNRLIPNAVEPRAALARPDGDGLTVEMTTQTPHGHRSGLAETLGIPEGRVRVVAPAVGGGFGHKGHHHPGETMAAWAARRLDRPVKWTATRTGNYLAGAHGRDHRTWAELAVDDDGTLRGLRADDHAAVGGYPLGSSPLLAVWWGRLLACQYELSAVHCHSRAVATTTAPVHSYRGAGRPEAIYVTERLVDAAARRLGIDPVELRRRNQVDPGEFPYETPTGATYDSGDYERAMDRALDAADYDRLRGDAGGPDRETAGGAAGTDPDTVAEDRYRGVGVACYVESMAGGFESGLVRVSPDGSVTAYAGTHSHGQGHGTTYAQVVADRLPVEYDDVAVSEGDTRDLDRGTGTFGSRSALVGGNAVRASADAVAEKAREVAAHLLEADPGDVAADAEAGGYHVVGAPDRTIDFAAVAEAAHRGPLPEGTSSGLEETTVYEPEETAYTFGTHVASVAVDPRTGDVDVERYVAVDDCGERINPRIVEGQVHGGVAQGIGQALYERAVYDDNGQLVTGSMTDYAVPRSVQVPEIETDATVTPSPTNPLGVKGIGEAGTIAAPPAVVNAVLDALEPLGVDHLDMPLTPERVWRAIHE